MATNAPPAAPADEEVVVPQKKYHLGLIDASNVGKRLRVRKTVHIADALTATFGANLDIMSNTIVPVGELSYNYQDYCRFSFNDKRMSVSRNYSWDILGGAHITLGVGCKYTGGSPNLKFNYVPRPNFLKAIAGGFALRSGQRIHAVPCIDLFSGKQRGAAEVDLAIMRKGVNEGRGAKGGLMVDLCSVAGIVNL